MKFLNQKVKISDVLLFVPLLLLLIVFQDVNLHLKINSYHNSFFDLFFKYVTYFGDGVLFPIFIILFLFIKKNESLKFVIASLFTLLVTFVLKKIIFKGAPRPIEFFGQTELHLIEGVKMCHWNTFPSGHSMAAFAMFVLLSLYLKSPLLKKMSILIAVLAAFSRVYLSQHFMLDIIVGGMIGVGIALYSDYLGGTLVKAYKKAKRKKKESMFAVFE